MFICDSPTENESVMKCLHVVQFMYSLRSAVKQALEVNSHKQYKIAFEKLSRLHSHNDKYVRQF